MQIEAGRNPKPVTVSVGSTVHFDSDTCVCYGDDCVRGAMVAQGIRRMEDRCKADVLVALDVAKPHPLSQLVVALIGLVVVAPAFCKLGCSRGPIMKYNRAVRAEKCF